MRRTIIMPTLIAHGGAGGRPPASDRSTRRRGILEAVHRGAEILRGGGSALDAVVATVVALENDPLFNAGYGSVLTIAGRVEMDAAVMTATRPHRRDAHDATDAIDVTVEGARATTSSAARRRAVAVEARAGGVVLVGRVRNPIELARAVMERTPHLLVGGAGAERLARQFGLRMCRPNDLISQRARERWFATRGEAPGQLPHAAAGPPDAHGTVGAVALDSHGDIAAATSTGGIYGKLPGRIGDSAIVGAGLFANARGGASATGEGEAIMRVALCREAVLALGRNRAQAAAERAIAMVADATVAQAGVIVLDAAGGVGYAHNAEVMEIALFHPNGFRHCVLEPLAQRAAPTGRSRK
jgi:L-asparaginase / beta-aspartyl-peptidase